MENLLVISNRQSHYVKELATERMPSYVIATTVIVVLSWLLHEFAHYLMGSALGYSMIMTLNSTYPDGGGVSSLDANLISAAGPVFTIGQAVVGYYLLRRYSDRRLYPILFVPLFMRVLAMVVSFNNPNDEARISMDLGIGMFTLPILVCAVLLFLVYRTSIRHNYSARIQGISALVTLLVSSAIILLDQKLHLVILGG